MRVNNCCQHLTEPHLSAPNSELPRRVRPGYTPPMWNLRELVERYTALAGGFGEPLALANFPLNDGELVRLFNAFDEDYHISRYLHFTNMNGKPYRIGGEDATHLSIDASVREIL
jgi:hypothetical protein